MEPSRSESHRAAEKAVELDPNDSGARSVLGLVRAYEHRWAESDSEFAAALSLDPSNADAWMHSAEITAFGGRPEIGIEHAQKSMRLNPLGGAWYFWELGLAQYAARRYEEAVTTLRHEAIYRTGARRILAASLAQLGRIEEAHEEAALFMANYPHFSSNQWASMQPFRDEAMRAHFVDGYRKAGLPE